MNYVELYEKNTKLYETRPTLRKAVLLFNQYLPFLFLAAYAGFFVYAAFAKLPLKDNFPFFVLLPLCTLAVVSALRLLVSKPRPYSQDGANITPWVNKKGAEYTSCPSRHIACAVAIAFAFFYFSLPIAFVLLVASLILAYCRFTVGVHYPSDMLFGACVPCIIYVVLSVITNIM